MGRVVGAAANVAVGSGVDETIGGITCTEVAVGVGVTMVGAVGFGVAVPIGAGKDVDAEVAVCANPTVGIGVTISGAVGSAANVPIAPGLSSTDKNDVDVGKIVVCAVGSAVG